MMVPQQSGVRIAHLWSCERLFKIVMCSLNANQAYETPRQRRPALLVLPRHPKLGRLYMEGATSLRSVTGKRHVSEHDEPMETRC